jgi:uncharacterized protein (TIGR02391 family)
MNLQTHIRSDLWIAISNTYQAENYSHAILDAMHHLSDVLREKSNVDADGVSLVGQALGGDSPRLRINKLQTETEQNIQRGIEHLVRGLYWAIRNLRSHEQAQDIKDTADAVIYFINYLLIIIAQSEEPFTLVNFVARVFDPDFVESDRYAKLLVDEIPSNKLTDAAVEIYRKKHEGEGGRLELIFDALFARLSETQTAQFLIVISDELKTTQDEKTIRLSLQILPANLWPRIDETARLRIENKLIRYIESGEAYSDSERVKGALGTWARAFLRYFTLREEICMTLLEKLRNDDLDHGRYVSKFFMGELLFVITEQWQITLSVSAISNIIRNGDLVVRKALINWVRSYPEEWQKKFAEQLKDLTDPKRPELYLSDGTPFLTSAIDDDDIPF